MATSELGALLHAGHQVAPAATRAMEGRRPPRVASGSHPSSSFSSRSSGEPTSREMAAGAAPGLRPGCLLQRAHREQGRSRHGDPDAGTRMRRLFVGNVDQDTCHSELDRLFYPYGRMDMKLGDSASPGAASASVVHRHTPQGVP